MASAGFADEEQVFVVFAEGDDLGHTVDGCSLCAREIGLQSRLRVCVGRREQYENVLVIGAIFGPKDTEACLRSLGVAQNKSISKDSARWRRGSGAGRNGGHGDCYCIGKT